MKKVITFFSLLLLLLSPLQGKEDYRIECQPIALEEALTLPCYGTLKQKDNGFAYIDVTNAFITAVVPLLDHEGMIRPRPTNSHSVGAHISVFHEQESIVPEELGRCFSFTVNDIRSFTIHTRDGLKKLWAITADSPELEQFRESYGLSPKLKGHEYHITLGKQLPTAPETWAAIEALSDFNFTGEPTEGLYVEGSFVKVEHKDILATAAKVNAVGQLKLKDNGYVYLDIDNMFVDGVWQQLPFEGQCIPVCTKDKAIGAHISVMYEDELVGREIWNLEQAGEWFTFDVKELRYVDRKTSKGWSRLWMLAVEAPGLERLRMHYGMNPKLKNHDFHITLGIEQIGARCLLDEMYPPADETFACVPAA